MTNMTNVDSANSVFQVHDAHGNPVRIECEKIAGKSAQLTQKIKSLTDILVPAYVQTETEFARSKPEAVAQDFMLRSLASSIQEDPAKTDWPQFAKKAHVVLEQFFEATDWAGYSHEQEEHIFVVAKDAIAGKQLACIQFILAPEHGAYTAKAALSGVIPAQQDRGLELILMSSIFKLYPDITRIFLHTRATNQRAIGLYKSWGFAPFAGPLPDWQDLEYLSQQSSVLQEKARELKS